MRRALTAPQPGAAGGCAAPPPPAQAAAPARCLPCGGMQGGPKARLPPGGMGAGRSMEGTCGRLSPAQLPASPILWFPRGAQYWGECLPACLLALTHWVATASSLTCASLRHPMPTAEGEARGRASGAHCGLHAAPRPPPEGETVRDAAGFVPHEAQCLGTLQQATAAGRAQCHGRLVAAPVAHWRVKVAPPPHDPPLHQPPLLCASTASVHHTEGPQSCASMGRQCAGASRCVAAAPGRYLWEELGGVRWKGRAPPMGGF